MGLKKEWLETYDGYFIKSDIVNIFGLRLINDEWWIYADDRGLCYSMARLGKMPSHKAKEELKSYMRKQGFI